MLPAMTFVQHSITLAKHCAPLVVYRVAANGCSKYITQTRLPIYPISVRTLKRWVAPTLRALQRRKETMGPQPPQPRSTYLEWNYDAEIFAFAKRLGEVFDDALLRRAFVHRSYVIQQELKENESELQDNRKLIKEGESLISSVINKNFEGVYPTYIINAISTYLTSEAILAHVALHMGVKDLVLSADFPVEKSTLAYTFKAIVGALHQSVASRTENFVKDFLISQLNGKDVMELWNPKEPYSCLQQLLKIKGYSQVEPRLCNQSATNTILANYQVGLYVDKKLLGIGWGESIGIAKDTAALDAIQRLENIK